MSATQDDIRVTIEKVPARKYIPEFSWSWFSIPSLLIVWMIIASFFPSYILPQFWEVAEEAWEWALEGDLHVHLGISLLEEVVGFGSAFIAAVILGFLAGFFQPFREYITPLNGLFMSIPPV
ncbi:MAG: ABC transporter permease, partial [Gammaproteobacteria bacterium]|nr:ABC transporter permease [Gammaproteobacteria bacterium]